MKEELLKVLKGGGKIFAIGAAAWGVVDRYATWEKEREELRLGTNALQQQLKNYEEQLKNYQNRERQWQDYQAYASQRPTPESPTPFYVQPSSDGDAILLEAGVSVSEGMATNYPPGAIKVEDSPGADELIKRILDDVRFLTSRAQGTVEVSIEIFGSADGIPLRENASYKGELGRLSLRYVCPSGEAKSVVLAPGDPLPENETIAALRAEAIRRRLCESLSSQPVSCVLHANTFEEVGGDLRRTLFRVRVEGYFGQEITPQANPELP